jgi:acyl carrier protein
VTSPSEDNVRSDGEFAAEVRRIVAETQQLPVDAVGAELDLEADLGVDSLALIEIAVALEQSLGVRALEVDEVDQRALVTVGDLIGFVAREADRGAAETT